MDLLNKFTTRFRNDIEGVREEVSLNQMYVEISFLSSLMEIIIMQKWRSSHSICIQ
jgi:hypothetical protein